ncbi:hypothetical protein [Sinorhizobium meliloti]|uniref:hypothetical protein n=1 Tax=Rhizobium meliloti TaxID=382 RepID=UPI000FD881F6|nr:hypothetical protein [Sinorhizobium meliloti]RVN50065.1 hypothetical protein CN108_30735 [Sinorhizobium meliloti]
MIDLGQADTLLTLARYNDFDKATAQECGPGDRFVVSGQPRCKITVGLGPVVATSQGVNYVRLSLNEYAVKLGWLGYGLMAGLGDLAGYALRGRPSN